jgi:hypothetical protein
MLQKFEKTIGNWSYRWLTVGGRHVLVKSVLEILPVYWLAIKNVPSTILNRIREMMYIFLWSRGKETEHVHLCNWEVLSKPKLQRLGFQTYVLVHQSIGSKHIMVLSLKRWTMAQGIIG